MYLSCRMSMQVHRQLLAVVGDSPDTVLPSDIELQEICQHLNEKKRVCMYGGVWIIISPPPPPPPLPEFPTGSKGTHTPVPTALLPRSARRG